MMKNFKDKRILQHFFDRVSNILKESDYIDQTLRKKAFRYGLTPEEYKEMNNKENMLFIKLALIFDMIKKNQADKPEANQVKSILERFPTRNEHGLGGRRRNTWRIAETFM